MDNKIYKRYKELTEKLAQGKLSDDEKKELAKLTAIAKKRRQGGRTSGRNDAGWYKKYPALMSSAANVPFNTVAGQPVFIPGGTHSTHGSTRYLAVGATLEYTRTVGLCQDANSSYNYQMRALWLEMHRKYRGMGAYEWADLGVIEFCIINAFADLARAERIYGLINNYKARNRSYPMCVLKALGFDTTVINGDRVADFRYQLNHIIAKAQTLCLPKGFSALECFLSLDANLFKDSDSVRANWFAYDAPVTYKYDPTVATGGAAVPMDRTRTTPSINGYKAAQTFADIITDLNTVFDALLNDTDVARVCSDVLACFGNDIVTLGFVPEDYTVDAIKDDSRLLQLHNTTIVGATYASRVPTGVQALGGCLYQENGFMKFELESAPVSQPPTVITVGSFDRYGWTTAATNLYVIPESQLADIWKDDVTEDDIIEMTRQMVAMEINSFIEAGVTYRTNHLSGFGLVVVNHMNIWSNATDASSSEPGGTLLASAASFYISLNTTNMPLFAAIEQFDWHPVIYSGSAGTLIPFMDLDNFVFISNMSISRIHEAAVLSAYKLTAMVEE